MKYNARKARSFKNSLRQFARNNLDGCNDYRSLRRNSRSGRPQLDGIEEAYDLVCQSDILVREVNTCNAPTN